MNSKERDFSFIRQPQADAFFQGYGQVEIDWIALTYYLWERVVQDLIECTHNVCFREDWGEENRAEAIQLLDVILAEERATSMPPIKPRPICLQISTFTPRRVLEERTD